MAVIPPEGSGTPVSITNEVEVKNDVGNPIPVNIISGGTGSTEYTEGDVDASITGIAAMWEDSGNTLRAVSVAKPLPVSAASLPLPTGAATAAAQATGNASLSSIDTKLTSPLSVTGTFFQATQPVSAASLPLPTGASTAANQATANASLSSIDSKLTSPLAVTGTFFQATQPVSAASLPLPTGASTAAAQATGNASLSSIDSKLTSPLTVTGPLTDAQLRATPVPVSGTLALSGTSTVTVDSEVASSFTHGQNTDIDSGANEQIVVASNPAKHSVMVLASTANTGTIYIGGSGVTSGNGVPIDAGDSLTFPVDNANKLYAISSVDNQALSWFAV